ncbi:transposase [Variovorax defluvii]|uniref:Transposase n=1 Tax=Variovorax defluvii TaxID=913761 RepID=A0ABP8HWG3_9BURK
MNPNSRKPRRRHTPELKAAVLVECQQPGASVAAVSLAHGLNVNLVRKWLVGKGLKRAGLSAPRTITQRAPVEPTAPSASQPVLHFVPVEVASGGVEVAPAASRCDAASTPPVEAGIHIELQRGETRLTVQWPGSQRRTARPGWSKWLRR